MLARFASLVLSALLLLQTSPAAPPPAAAQRGSRQNSLSQQSASAAPPQPSIRSTTRLVQVSVVAVDKSGNPVTGLSKEDFSVSDQGAPQTISIFSAESPAPAVPVHLLPANAFTNRYDLKGQDPGAVTVILFDALNTAPEDQAYARKQLLKFLQTLKPEEHVALYALTNHLYILHDFTQDSAALVEAIGRFTPKESAAFDASTTAMIDLVSATGDSSWAAFQNNLNNANGEIADQNTINRVISTASAIEAIANHISIVPGRKSLVWVSGGFPLSIGLTSIGSVDRDTQTFATGTLASTASDNPVGGSSAPNQLTRPDREQLSNSPDVATAVQALNRANVSIYPIDVKGVELHAGMSSDNRTPSTSLADGGFFDRFNTRDTSNILADRTGGLAFYGNNDINQGIRRAFDDGRYTYTIGFYPDHNTWNGKYREIKIQVRAPGVKLRYRRGYFAVPEQVSSPNAIAADLQDAAFSPLDSTALSMIVSGKSMPSPPDHKLELQVGLDPKQLLLQSAAGHRKGALDMMFLQQSATGEVLSAEKQHFDVNLEDRQFAYLSRAGMVLLRHVTVDPKAVQLRVIVRDAGSGSVGSVAIPLKSLIPASDSTATPSFAKPS